MSDPRSTADWEALLDGTTPGPWEARQDGHDPVWTVGRLGDTPAHITADAYGEGNARLAAAAPEAVAEVIRLREELEQMRRDADKALKSRWGSSSYAEDIPTLRETSERAARILEGHNDEVS